MRRTDIAVVVAPGGNAQAAERLAEKVGTALVGEKDGGAAARSDTGACEGAALVVRFAADGVSLQAEGMTLRVDFAEALPRLASGRLQRELLVKAARVKGVPEPMAVDATAGLGGDSLLLAAAGFTVYLFEQDPVIAALLRDALRRAAADPRLTPVVARMHFAEGDSLAALASCGQGEPAAPARGLEAGVPLALPARPDVVYLDPMFPERRKSAAVKKRFQLLHHLERPCANQEEMLRAALLARPRKVVVKRPAKGPYLADVKPGYSVAGKAVRYDVIVPPRS